MFNTVKCVKNDSVRADNMALCGFEVFFGWNESHDRPPAHAGDELYLFSNLLR